MKSVLSRKEMLKYFTDKWYQDGSNYFVRYNSDIRNNRYEDSYIYKILNSVYKEDKYKNLSVIGNVRLLTKEEVDNLDEEYKNIGKYYWTMTTYNNMNELEDGKGASMLFACDNGRLSWCWVNNGYGVRPVITLNIDELE